MKAIAVLLLGLFVCPALASDTHEPFALLQSLRALRGQRTFRSMFAARGSFPTGSTLGQQQGGCTMRASSLKTSTSHTDTASSFFAMASRSSHSVSASIRTNRPIFAFSSTISIRPRSFGSVNSRHGVSANSANRVQIIQTNVNRVFAHYTVSLCALLIPGKGRFE